MTDVPVTKPENVTRGTLVALLAIPLGVVVWVIISNFGFIASFVTLGIAYLAMFLYTRASGGGFSRTGAIRVAIITLVTLALAIFAGIVSNVAQALVDGTGHTQFEAISNPDFWNAFNLILSDPDNRAQLIPNVLISIAFGLLGCFGILRTAFRRTAPATIQPPAQQGAPSAAPTYQPTVDMYNEPLPEPTAGQKPSASPDPPAPAP